MRVAAGLGVAAAAAAAVAAALALAVALLVAVVVAVALACHDVPYSLTPKPKAQLGTLWQRVVARLASAPLMLENAASGFEVRTDLGCTYTQS